MANPGLSTGAASAVVCDTQGVTIVESMAPTGPAAPEVSRLVFGNSHMFGVMVEIASLRGRMFSSKQISDATQLSPGIVHPLIQKLRRARFIEFVEQVHGERTLLYRVVDNHVWEAASRYAEERDAASERSAS